MSGISNKLETERGVENRALKSLIPVTVFVVFIADVD